MPGSRPVVRETQRHHQKVLIRININGNQSDISEPFRLTARMHPPFCGREPVFASAAALQICPDPNFPALFLQTSNDMLCCDEVSKAYAMILYSNVERRCVGPKSAFLFRSDKIKRTLSRTRIAASISSRILPPIFRSCGANQQRTPLFCKSPWRRSAK